MSHASGTDDVIDEFMARRGDAVDSEGWERSYNKSQCPECGGLHDEEPTECSVCGWAPC